MPLQYHLSFQFVSVIIVRQYCEQSSVYTADYKGGMLANVPRHKRTKPLSHDSDYFFIFFQDRDGDVNID